MKRANNILLKLLGILLLTAAILKGWQLINGPMANNSLWTNRIFLISIVEFELALSIWLLSGLFKKAAWLASLSCFSLFSIVTLYKAVTGYESCGCFGTVHVNPWITLFAIDLPSVSALSIFHPRLLSLKPLISFLHLRRELHQGSIKSIIVELLHPLPKPEHFAIAFAIGFVVLGITTPILALNKPAVVTSRYKVLEPQTWVGKELPILENIDIKDPLRKGNWLVLFYHYDCPDCAAAIPKYEQMARDLAGNEDFLRIAFIAVPPYGKGPVRENSPGILGKLDTTKEWFVTTPAVALMKNGRVEQAWEEKAPNMDEILRNFAKK